MGHAFLEELNRIWRKIQNRAVIITCATLPLSPILLTAKPTDPIVKHGNISIDKSNLNIVSKSSKGIIHWKDFSLNQEDIAKFVLPDSSSAILNKVTSNIPSKLLGKLTSNGQIYLINPNGILIGKEGSIHAASFIASTLDLPDDRFLKGDGMLFSSDKRGKIENHGSIKTSFGNVYLLSQYIENTGSIKAQNGNCYLVASNKILIEPKGEKHITILGDIKGKIPGTGIQNSGSINGNQIELLADGNPYSIAIKHTGFIEAQSTKIHDGKVFLVSETGSISIKESAAIIAKSQEEQKSEINILGKHISLDDNAYIKTTESNYGGNIFIGGGYQGKNKDKYNSQSTHIGRGVKIFAEPSTGGDGGRVIIWSDGDTHYDGYISTRGGNKYGDGGFIEISGKKDLAYRGLIDTRAKNGKTGILLLDPTDITISGGATSGGAFSGGDPDTFSGTAATAVLNNGDLQTALSAANVIVTTASAFGSVGDITVSSNTDLTSPGNDLTLIATNDITTNNLFRFTDTSTNTATLTLTAAGDININQNFRCRDALACNLTATTGSITTNTSSDMDCDGTTLTTFTAPALTGDITLLKSFDTDAGAGSSSITFDAGQDIIIGGSTVDASITTTSGTITLDAGRDILLTAGTGGGDEVEISTITDSINVTAGRDLILDASPSLGTNSFIQIGTTDPIISSDINITTGRNLTLISGSSNNNSTQIGFDGAGTTATIDSNITLSVGGNVTLTAGSADNTFSLIGHGSDNVSTEIITGDIIFSTLTGDITLTGGSGAGGSFAHIGHVKGGNGGGVTITGDITIPSAGTCGNIILAGGSGDAGYALLGHGGRIDNQTDVFSGHITLNATSIDVTAGTASTGDAFAGIGYFSRVTGTGTSTITSSSVDVTSVGSITLQSNPSENACIGVRIEDNSGAGTNSAVMDSISITTTGVAGDLNILGASTHTASNIAMVGCFVVEGTSSSPLTIDLSGDLVVNTQSGGASTAVSTFIQNGNGLTPTNVLSITTAGDISILGGNGPASINAQDTLTIDCSGSLMITSASSAGATASITSVDTATITVADDATFTGDPANDAFIEVGTAAGSASLTFEATSGAIAMPADTRIENIDTGAGTLSVTSGTTTTLSDGAFISNDGTGLTSVTVGTALSVTTTTTDDTFIDGAGGLTVLAGTSATLLGATPGIAYLECASGDLSFTTTSGTLTIGADSRAENLSVGAETFILSSGGTMVIEDGGFVNHDATGLFTLGCGGDFSILDSSSLTTSGPLTGVVIGSTSIMANATGDSFLSAADTVSFVTGTSLTLTGSSPNEAYIETSSGDLSVTATTGVITVGADTRIENTDGAAGTMLISSGGNTIVEDLGFLNNDGSGTFTLTIGEDLNVLTGGFITATGPIAGTISEDLNITASVAAASFISGTDDVSLTSGLDTTLTGASPMEAYIETSTGSLDVGATAGMIIVGADTRIENNDAAAGSVSITSGSGTTVEDGGFIRNDGPGLTSFTVGGTLSVTDTGFVDAMGPMTGIIGGSVIITASASGDSFIEAADTMAISVASDITLIGSSPMEAYIETSSGSMSLSTTSGAITLGADTRIENLDVGTGTLSITTGTDLDASSGGFINSDGTGLSLLTIGNDLNLTDSSFLTVGGALVAAITADTNITSTATGSSFLTAADTTVFTTGSDLILTGTAANEAYLEIATGNLTVGATSGTLTLDPNARIENFSAGTGTLSVSSGSTMTLNDSSLIRNVGTGSSTFVASGDLSISDGSFFEAAGTLTVSSSAALDIAGPATSYMMGADDTSVMATSDITLLGTAPSEVYIENTTGNLSVESISGSISIGADARIESMDAGTGTIDVASGTSTTLSDGGFVTSSAAGLATLITGTSCSISDGSFIDVGGAITGDIGTTLSITATGVDTYITADGNVMFTTGSTSITGTTSMMMVPSEAYIETTTGNFTLSSLTGGISLSGNTRIENMDAGATSMSITTTTGDLLIADESSIIHAGSGTTMVSAGMDLIIQDGSFIDVGGRFTGFILDDVKITGSATGSSFISAADTTSITAINNIELTGISGTEEGYIDVLSGSGMIIANKNIEINDFARITNQGLGSLTLVVDNDDPVAPVIGNGAFVLTGSVGKAGGGLLRIFTARRSQNSITGTGNVNGDTFVPGTLFLNTTTEQWDTYFPDTFGGTPYTFFYKDDFVPTPPSPIIVIPTPEQIQEIIVPNSEMAYMFSQSDGFYFLRSRFSISKVGSQTIYLMPTPNFYQLKGLRGLQ